MSLRSLRSSIRSRAASRRARRLRSAVAGLSLDARHAMLAALYDDELIVGAYADRHGRVCPMLAAHRRGARSDVGDFPRAWDDFARARRPRRATARELEILKALLEEGLDRRADQAHRPAPLDPHHLPARSGEPAPTPTVA
jgi:hypothetical protein